MRNRIWVLLVLITMSTETAVGQNEAEACFDQAVLAFEADDYAAAIAGFEKVINDYPLSEWYPFALFNLSYVHFKIGDFYRAIAGFKDMIAGNFDDEETHFTNLMESPFTLYKHRSADLISTMYLQLNLADSALAYRAMADTVYPYRHFCGNCYASQRAYTVMCYADIYEQLGDTLRAVQALLPEALENLSGSDAVLRRIEALLQNQKGLKDQLDRALSEIQAKHNSDAERSWNWMTFRFLETDMHIPETWRSGQESVEVHEAQRIVRGSAFYGMITALGLNE